LEKSNQNTRFQSAEKRKNGENTSWHFGVVEIHGGNLQIWGFWLRDLRGGDRGAANLKLMLVGRGNEGDG
jgi:hypothetical protein